MPKIRRLNNILLVRPPLYIRDDKAITNVNAFYPPYGLALLASVLKENEFNPTVRDMIDSSWSQAEEFFNHASYDFVGISCWTGQHLNCFRLAEIAKVKMQPKPIVIIGGPHPSAERLDIQICSNYPQIDFIIRGEAERTVVELLDKINQKQNLETVKGITFSKEGRIIRNPERELIRDLDSLPFADYSFFDFERTRNISDGRINISRSGTAIPFAPIISSRGCPNECQFCAIFMGKAVRFRSPENVVDEIEYLYRSNNITHFTFVDDCFNASLTRAENICQLIIERELPITWTAMTRIKPLSEKFLNLAKRSGCLLLAFGIESGSPEILKLIDKNIDINDFLKAVLATRKAEINSVAMFMVGNPNESKATIDKTLQLIKKSKIKEVIISPTTILPNSKLYSFAIDKGLIDDEYWLNNSSLPYYTAEYDLDQLRYLRLKILFFHHLYQRNFSLIIKFLILILGYKLIKLFNLDANRVRDFLLDLPLAGALLKRLKTAEF